MPLLLSPSWVSEYSDLRRQRIPRLMSSNKGVACRHCPLHCPSKQQQQQQQQQRGRGLLKFKANGQRPKRIDIVSSPMNFSSAKDPKTSPKFKSTPRATSMPPISQKQLKRRLMNRMVLSTPRKNRVARSLRSPKPTAERSPEGRRAAGHSAHIDHARHRYRSAQPSPVKTKSEIWAMDSKAMLLNANEPYLTGQLRESRTMRWSTARGSLDHVREDYDFKVQETGHEGFLCGLFALSLAVIPVLFPYCCFDTDLHTKMDRRVFNEFRDILHGDEYEAAVRRKEWDLGIVSRRHSLGSPSVDTLAEDILDLGLREKRWLHLSQIGLVLQIWWKCHKSKFAQRSLRLGYWLKVGDVDTITFESVFMDDSDRGEPYDVWIYHEDRDHWSGIAPDIPVTLN